jgi:two-component system, NtrC family, sensor histidine kinase PilS
LRVLTGVSDETLRSALDPRRFVRWIYAGRLSLATAVFVAAIKTWFVTEDTDKLIATLAFAFTLVFTVGSGWFTAFRTRQLTNTFLYGQFIFDVLLITAIVHVLPVFAPLYIVVNTSAALLLPTRGSLLVAAFGCVLYAADVLALQGTVFSAAQAFQVGIFIVAALAISSISARLQAAGASSKQLVAALDQVRLEAADILGNIRSGILTIDINGAVLYANAMASELLGFNLDTYESQPVLPRIAQVSPGLTAALERAIERDTYTEREEARVTDATRAFPIGITTTSNPGGANRIGRSITAIFQDISDQKRVDQLRRRAERLEAVAELSASLAHEIRNPLASIRSAVEQLGQSPRTTADEQTLARLIVRESDRLSRLLGEFLDFARTRVTRIKPQDLGAIARAATNLAAAHPSRTVGVTVECVGPTSPVIIEGDEDLLHRAVFNLALNAVQAAPPRGYVRVEILAALDDDHGGAVRSSDGVVGVRVTDNGGGIDASIRDRIFQPFATTKPGGSGLGLAVTHRAVEAHNGAVLVDSSEQGTRFTVILPRTQAPDAAERGEKSDE